MTEAPHLVSRAVLKTLLYADIFDFPLTPREIHHYLIQCHATMAVVEAQLQALAASAYVEECNGQVAIAGRSQLFEVRHERTRRSAQLWPLARHWGTRLAALPFVRMVGVTGALAVSNVGARPDIDFLLVTAPDRLWLCRALAIALVKTAAMQGVQLCPNYLVTMRRLRFQEHNLFTAHDLTQMVPLYGESAYRSMWEQNAWRKSFLPQANSPLTPPRFVQLSPKLQCFKIWTERALAGRVGARLEVWEQQRKARKLYRQAPAGEVGRSDGLVFDSDVCKGHFGGHGQRTLQAYQTRLQHHGLEEGTEYAYRH
ncbi:MAG: hypothetical protein M5U01_14105 [Ardenticatenaceae bacterium]|nr:hypothetical protein [Ardenticatenaceae bacterium]